ncbi:MAG: hypothetical protein AAFV98_13170 [Chloroflexota bacterium]
MPVPTVLNISVLVLFIFGVSVLFTSAQSRIVIPTMDEDRETDYFPAVSGNNINGDTYMLPQDFAGDYNVVLLAFDQVHQRLVETWIPTLRDLESENELIRIYEVPTLPEYGPVTRFTTDLAMSGGIQEELARETTITLYTNLALMQEAIGFETTDTIHIILVDSEGEVYWQTSGAYTDAKYESLTEVLTQLQADTIPNMEDNDA